MRVFTAITIFSSLSTAAYVIQDDYSPNNFASMFDFFTGDDPTDGYVNYVDQTTAQNSGLYKIENNQVYMGVDSTNVASGRGRNSIRISSKKTYNHGLIILDLAHMPGGDCGTWPAFWMLGPDWPTQGEIDIIEGVNTQVGNSFAMHTNAGCSITNTGNFAGTLKYSNCDSYAPSQPDNVGCSIASSNDQSYGTGFNSVGGGIYATQWTSQAISIWFFPRSAIPNDIASGNPNPENWGLPSAQFTGNCDIDEHVKNQQLVFDMTFCGQWAGAVWSQDATCSTKATTCQDYVMKNPGAFQDTYWSINSLRVYQDNGAPASSVAGASSTSSSAAVVAPTVTTSTTLATLTSTTPVVPTTTSLLTSSLISSTTVVTTVLSSSLTTSSAIYTTPSVAATSSSTTSTTAYTTPAAVTTPISSSSLNIATTPPAITSSSSYATSSLTMPYNTTTATTSLPSNSTTTTFTTFTTFTTLTSDIPLPPTTPEPQTIATVTYTIPAPAQPAPTSTPPGSSGSWGGWVHWGSSSSSSSSSSNRRRRRWIDVPSSLLFR